MSSAGSQDMTSETETFDSINQDDTDWGRQPIDKLKGNDLLWATIAEAAGRRKDTKAKQCLFCGLAYTGGPFQIRVHLDASIKPRSIRACTPMLEWRERRAEVVNEMRRRKRVVDDEAAEKQRLDAAKLEGRAAAGDTTLFQAVGMDAVNEAWMRVVVSKALPLGLFDDPEFRNAVALTAMAGRAIVVRGKDTFLPKRVHMTNKVLPKLDMDLDNKIATKVKGLANLTGAVIISDGWTNVANRPILNALAALPIGSYFLEAIDTSGQTKDAKYIADFIVKNINAFGAADVVGVCMDGACTSSFPLIEKVFPHVFTFICPTHSLDNFMKNICCDKSIIRVKGVEGEFDWGENFFSDAIDKVWEVVKFVSHHHQSLARFRDLGAEVPKCERPKGGMELLRYAETRFASKIMMIERYQNVLPVLERLVIDDVYTSWLSKQPTEVRARGAEIKRIVRDETVAEAVSVCVKSLVPVVRLLRLTDTKLGATLGKVYAYMLQLDEYFRQPIDGMPERMRLKLHAIFMARWEYFHVPVMTAAYRFEPEFCRRSFSSLEMKDVKDVLRKMACDEHPLANLFAHLADYEEALLSGTHDLDDSVAFSAMAQKITSYKWAKIYLARWPDLAWATTRLLSMTCSASGCEDSWSVEGWFHSKKRNRMGQKTVERLVRAHTNLVLERRFEEAAFAVLPWDLEMVLDEPSEEE